VLFNSYTYILVYLPLVLGAYCALLRSPPFWRTVWLGAASLYFYAYWAARYIPLLLASALFNFLMGRLLEEKARRRSLILGMGVVANLALLIGFKYTNFLVAQIDALIGFHIPEPDISLPIGISFFTFTQIAYLVDLSRNVCGRYDIWRYILFVSFFPHLLAGPILHHREMMPQFARQPSAMAHERQISHGLLIFSIGLFKKVCLADSMAPYANAAFAAADQGADLSLAAAWWGAVAYTLQLYFDFSGYSDMAIGSARLFGIRLPLNFNAPYRAPSIIEFWRRWHMSLSRFLRDYLYIPLGGNRRGPVRRHVNLLLTMFLGGIWHGAGYGFAVWGLLHGLYLIVNHAWRALRRSVPMRPTALERLAGGLLTFLAVVVAWVFFRATTLSSALHMLVAMAGFTHSEIHQVANAAAEATRRLASAGLSTALLTMLDLDTVALPSHAILGSTYGLLMLPPLLAVATLGPTSQQAAITIMRWARSSRPSQRWMAGFASGGVAILFLLAFSRLNHVTEFLYFQF
jgi:alginate O-acetyltransferase complex protein AlgI